MDEALRILATDQKRWSATANLMKANIGLARLVIMCLAVGGAVLGTLAAQATDTAATALGFAGATCLALLAVIRQFFLSTDRTQAWILARAASESFKREMFLYRASAAHYAAGDRTDTVSVKRDEILAKVKDAQKFAQDPAQAAVEVPGPLDLKAYKTQRVEHQKNWFRNKANKYGRARQLYSGAELLLAAVGALLGVGVTVNDQQALGAWIAVITTVLGVIGAHVAAQRYDQLTVSFRAAADRLETALLKFEKVGLQQLVEECEAILLQENQGWIAGINESFKVVVGPAAPQQGKSVPAPAGRV